MNKDEIVSYFDLNSLQVKNIEFFISLIIKHNNHTNLIGKSTITNFWDRHVLDCLQLANLIKNKKYKILDLGTGAGLPGILLSLIGYQNVLMVESVRKKTDFVRKVINEMSLVARVENKRIEKVKTSKQDIIVSRALAPLKKLLTYARMHSNKNTTSLFLKGRSVNNEIEIAMESFVFDYKKINSISKGDGCILKINNIKKKDG